MENSKWRVWAKVIAYVEFVVIPLALIALLSADVILTAHGTGSFTVLCIFTGIDALIMCILLYAAVKLRRSTQIERNVNDAIGKARFWRNVTIVYLVFEVLEGITLSIMVTPWWIWDLVISVLWNGGAVYIVIRFISDLEDVGVGTYPFSVVTQE